MQRADGGLFRAARIRTRRWSPPKGLRSSLHPRRPSKIGRRSPMRAQPPSPVRARSDRPSVASLGWTASKRATSMRGARDPACSSDPTPSSVPFPSANRPTSSWTNRTADHPAGLLIQSGRIRSPAQIETGRHLGRGRRSAARQLRTALVTVRQAYERRATRLSGATLSRKEICCRSPWNPVGNAVVRRDHDRNVRPTDAVTA